MLIQAAEDPADDRTLTFRGLRDRAERTAAGLYAHGVRPHHTVRLAAAPPHRDRGALPGAGPARRPPDPRHPRLPGPRGPPSPCAPPAPPGTRTPATGAATDYTALAARVARGDGTAAQTLTAYDSLPEADPGTVPLPPPPDDGTRVRGSTGPPAPPRHPVE
ncbi:hypothetical protein TPA0909_55190 [Streptomyces albus]|nr:hypothetical protein TPA0909_55190 [Streptomyces albus]